MTFEAVAVGISGLVVGRLFGFGLAGDPLDEFWHDREAGAQDYGCELAHAVDIVSMVLKRIGLIRSWGTHFHRPTLMIEYVSSEV